MKKDHNQALLDALAKRKDYESGVKAFALLDKYRGLGVSEMPSLAEAYAEVNNDGVAHGVHGARVNDLNAIPYKGKIVRKKILHPDAIHREVYSDVTNIKVVKPQSAVLIKKSGATSEVKVSVKTVVVPMRRESENLLSKTRTDSRRKRLVYALKVKKGEVEFVQERIIKRRRLSTEKMVVFFRKPEKGSTPEESKAVAVK